MNKGVLAGIGAYLIWGFFPIYLKTLQVVPPLQIMLHRLVWSFLFVMLLILVRKEWQQFRSSIFSSRVLLTYSLTAVLLAANWLIYIYGVNSGQVIETSLGYFINPLINVALGVVILRERLRPMQWLPVGLAAIGVLYLTLQYGSLPWIALALAFSFGLYGLIKKVAPLGSLHGQSLETGILFVPAVIYLFFAQSQGFGAFGHQGLSVTLLLAFAGIVTALPLLLFGFAARTIPLSLLGILQYIAPTIQFLLGVYLYQEPFTTTRLIGFAFIWIALLIFTLEGVYARRKQVAAAPVA
ncbi:MAG: EamA family transporter RarD [Chloroflexota bacterium]|nr:MAG: EamA family transporter RarD [Chloroflexota bacterium]